MITRLSILNYMKQKEQDNYKPNREALHRDDIKGVLCDNNFEREEFDKIFDQMCRDGVIFECYPNRFKVL